VITAHPLKTHSGNITGTFEEPRHPSSIFLGHPLDHITIWPSNQKLHVALLLQIVSITSIIILHFVVIAALFLELWREITLHLNLQDDLTLRMVPKLRRETAPNHDGTPLDVCGPHLVVICKENPRCLPRDHRFLLAFLPSTCMLVELVSDQVKPSLGDPNLESREHSTDFSSVP
jgi:hypothetical protein